MNFVIFFVLVIGCFVQDALGCTCVFDHPQNQFCNAEFVIRAQALGVRQVTQQVTEIPHDPLSLDFDRIIYTVKILESFKGELEIGEKVDLFTSDSSASCGIQLNTTEKLQYLLTGYRRQGKYRINICLWNSLWSDLDNCIKDRLGSIYNSKKLPPNANHLYRNNCKPGSCKVKLCSEQEGDCNSSGDTCTFTFKKAMRNSICVRSGRGYYGKKKPCQWKKCR